LEIEDNPQALLIGCLSAYDKAVLSTYSDIDFAKNFKPQDSQDWEALLENAHS